MFDVAFRRGGRGPGEGEWRQAQVEVDSNRDAVRPAAPIRPDVDRTFKISNLPPFVLH
jgi:hypothetical protein